MFAVNNPPPIFKAIFCGMMNKLNNLMVEAGGIEPPSESLQLKAATCLACVLNLEHVGPAGRLPVFQPLKFPGCPGV